MSLRLLVSVAAFTLGVIAWSAAALAGPQTSAKTGGTLRVNMSDSDIQTLDTAIDYEFLGWTVGFATCAKLLNYPDRPAPVGSQLGPEVARGMPVVSSNGKTYTFGLRSTFRFNTGERVTPASFVRAFERGLSKKMSSPAASFMADIVGAKAVMAGKGEHLSGVTASGNTLTVRLTKSGPDFLARLGMNFFCAVPADLPIDPNGVERPPSAGPFYVAERVVNRRIVLKRNPYYGGNRPVQLDEIDFTANVDQAQSLLQVQKGEADIDIGGLPPPSQAKLAKQYGVNKGRYFAHPFMSVIYVAMNTSRPLFKDVALRKAVNYAIDRPSLILQSGYLGGTPTDQILPPTMRGFREAHLYPVGRPDLPRAKQLAAGKGGKAVLYTDTSPVSSAQAELIQAQLKPIGIDVEIRKYAFGVLTSKIGVRDEPYDLVLIGWFADYADPYDFINVLMDGRTIAPNNNVNNARFNDPRFNARMDKAQLLIGPSRYATYGKLDVDIMRIAAPWAPFNNTNVREFVSSRVGCYLYQPVFAGMDLATGCLK
jgi:peptide/nickel transport system substrate-binding protein